MLLYTKNRGSKALMSPSLSGGKKKIQHTRKTGKQDVEKNLWLMYEKTWEGEVFKIIKMERRDLSGTLFLRSLDFMSQDIVVYFANLTWDRHNF